jgi:tetratricopeptide (TPR) repeat protein
VERCVTSTQNGHKFYSMHVLVQGFIQANYKEVHGYPSSRLVARLLGSAITVGDQYENLASNRLITPHLRLFNPGDIMEAGDHYGYGVVLEEVVEGRLAVSHLERCVEIWRRFLGEESILTLNAMKMLAISYSTVGKEEEALEMRQRVRDTWKNLVGEDHLDTIRSTHNLAYSYSNLGRDVEALPLKEEVIERQRRLLGEDRLNTLSSLHGLAISYSNLGRHDEALSLWEQLVNRWRELLGEHHGYTLDAMQGLVCTYARLGRKEDASKLLSIVSSRRNDPLKR